MKQTVRHGLGIALSAMAFVCNYSPWVRNAAALPDADSSALPKQQNVAASAPIRVRLKPGRYILLSRESALTGIGSFPRHLNAERRR